MRTHAQQPAQPNTQRTNNPGAFSTPVPGLNDSGFNVPPEVATPAHGFQQGGSFNSPAPGDMSQPLPRVDQGAGPKLPLLLIGVVVLALVMAGLVYAAFFMDSGATEAPTPAPPDVAEAAPAPTPQKERAVAVVDDGMVTIEVGSLPSGADVYKGEDKLGETPLELKLSEDLFPLELSVRKEGHVSQTFTLTEESPDYDAILKKLEGDALADGEEGDTPGASGDEAGDEAGDAPPPSDDGAKAPPPAAKNTGSKGEKKPPKGEKKPPKGGKKPPKDDGGDDFFDIDIDTKDTPQNTGKKPGKNAGNTGKTEKETEKKDDLDNVLDGW